MGKKTRIRKIIDAGLAPAGWAFHAVSRFRAEYYTQPSRKVRLPAPCVSVGNLTFGGTGKTPFTVFLVRECLSLGFHPAVLLRGYGRKSHGCRPAVPGSTWEEVGDEALVLAAELPGTPILVGERREGAAALAPAGTDLFILDDGFQHLKVHRDLDIVLVDLSRPEDLAVPPRGRLREPLDSLCRAHLLVLTHGEISQMPLPVALRWAGRPRAGARFAWGQTVRPGGETWKDLAGQPCAAFAGIAHPDVFFQQAREQGLELAHQTAFPDHAAPTPERLAQVLGAAGTAGARWALCTQKDFVKWAPAWPTGAPPLRYPELAVRLDDPAGCLRPLLQSLRVPV